jgi:SSS family solute:Na+ symporter
MAKNSAVFAVGYALKRSAKIDKAAVVLKPAMQNNQ